MKILREGKKNHTDDEDMWVGAQESCSVCDCAFEFEVGDPVEVVKGASYPTLRFECPWCHSVQHQDYGPDVLEDRADAMRLIRSLNSKTL